MRSVLRREDSVAEETRRSLWQRNCCGTERVSTEEGVVGGTNAFVAVVGAKDHALCAVEAQGGAIAWSSTELLSANVLLAPVVPRQRL